LKIIINDNRSYISKWYSDDKKYGKKNICQVIIFNSDSKDNIKINN